MNGKSVEEPLQPGTFVAVRRTWKSGDRIEFTLDRPMRLAPIDKQHPNQVAVMHGPLTLFAVGNLPPNLKRSDLLANTHGMKMLSYPAIKDETYRLYLPVTT